MNGIMAFSFESMAVRAIQDENEEPWFVAKDVCVVLGILDPSMAVSSLDIDEKGTSIIGTPSGNQQMLTVSESGLYKLIFKSRKPEAKRFTKWVTSELLPQVRKTGGFNAAVSALPQDYPSALRALADEAEQRALAEAKTIALTAQAEADKPKVLFAESVGASGTDINVGELAKILNQNGHETGQNRLFSELNYRGYVMRRSGQWVPTQKSMDLGVMRIKETSVSQSGKDPIVRLTTKITGKGQVYFVKKYQEWM